MTYDALLALRGWGEAEFRTVAPDFAAATRFALFAERLAPLLSEAQVIMAEPLPSDPVGKLEAAKRKMTVEQEIPRLRAALYPEDDDG